MFHVLVTGSGSHCTAHSLSWSRDKEPNSNGIMYAKIWTPEDPRAIKNNDANTSFALQD